ncbi:MAG: helix-turn-helix domain-containing protein [Henriciella sp.]
MHASNTLSGIEFSAEQKRFATGTTEFMRASTVPLYDMTPIKWDGFTGRYISNAWFGQDVLFTQTTNDAVAITRRKSQAENGAHLIFVHRYLAGGVRGQFGDVSLDRDPGSIYLFDQAQRVDCIQFPTTVQGMFIPKRLLGYTPDLHAPLIQLAADSPNGRALAAEFTAIFDQLFNFDRLELARLDRLIACLRSALGTAQDDLDIRRQYSNALRDLIRARIERDLSSPDLNVSTLLSEFGVSRASLYRMFESVGGVRRYINDRRVFRAVAEISNNPIKRGGIAEIAEKWGFNSNSGFTRMVRDHFGVAPSSLSLSGAPEIDYPMEPLANQPFAQQTALLKNEPPIQTCSQSTLLKHCTANSGAATETLEPA